jgi:hypothetical protein
MGISYKTYVGPYVHCAAQVIDVTVVRRGCTNAACVGAYGGGPFCSRCGSPIGDRPIATRAHAVDAWEVSNTLNERLSTPGGDAYVEWAELNESHLWLPNVPYGRNGHLEEYADFALVPLTAGAIALDLTTFASAFADDLRTLREIYGADAVNVYWGVVQHYY